MNTNEYIKIYNEMCVGNKKVKKSKPIHKSSILLESKRKTAKIRCKQLILEDDNKPKEFKAQIEVVSELASIEAANKWTTSPEVLSLPNHIFSESGFETKDINPEELAKFGLSEATQSAKDNFKDKLDDKHCLIYLFSINEIGPDDKPTGTKFFVLANSANKNCFEIVPKDNSWMLDASRNIKIFAEKNKEDGLFYFAANNITFPLEVLNVGTNFVKGCWGALSNAGSNIMKHSPIIRYFKNKMGGDSDKEEKKEKDYSKLVQQYLNRIQEIRDNKMEDFMKIDKDLRKKVKSLLRGEDVDGFPNYKKMLDEKKPFNKEQFELLKDFAEKDFANAMAASEAFNDISKDPSQLPDQPSKADAKAYSELKDNKAFQSTAKKLGFRDKKKLEGLAGFFQNLLDSLFSLFGPGDPNEADASRIKELIPTVAKYVKGMEPGDYPVFFGPEGAKIDDGTMEEKFKSMIKK